MPSCKERYHAVIYAYGCERDRHMGIEGEELPGSWAATEFVAWYNGHPDFQDLDIDLSAKRAVVIGNGNVAMDVARMLVLPREELEGTDTTDAAIDAIADSGVEEVVIVGRRGPAQAAFTNPELRELGELTDADVIVDPAEVELDRHSARSIEGEGQITHRRNVEILADYAGREPQGKPKRVVLRFLRSPVAIHGDGKVESIELVRNELEHGGDGRLRAQATGEHETLECGLVFRSIGYRGASDRRGAVRRLARHDPERGGPDRGPGCRARRARRVRDRVGQARSIRGDRHQQARCAGDRRARARGPGRGPSGRSSRRRPRRRPGAGARAPAGRGRLRAAGRRSTPPRRRPASRSVARA